MYFSSVNRKYRFMVTADCHEFMHLLLKVIALIVYKIAPPRRLQQFLQQNVIAVALIG
jgi:hypothetical protein